MFYHKSCLCFTTNCFFVLPQIVSLFYYKLFLCFTTNHFLFGHKLSQNVWLSVSEWLLFIANSAVFLAISWRELFIFQWDDYYLWTRPTLFDEIIIVLAHWSNSLQVGMSLHLDTLSWFKANQSLLLLLNAACLAKKQQIPISIFGLTRPGLKTMLYYTLQVSTLPLHHMMWSYNF